VSDIVWEDPPSSRTGNPRWAAFVDQLKEHPGKWAIAEVTEKQNRCGTCKLRLEARGCETVSRKTSDTPVRWTIYARWPESS
jgi:hypothetical protein